MINRLLGIDVMLERKTSRYKYKGFIVKVAGSILGYFELDIEGDSRACFEHREEFLTNAIKIV